MVCARAGRCLHGAPGQEHQTKKAPIAKMAYIPIYKSPPRRTQRMQLSHETCTRAKKGANDWILCQLFCTAAKCHQAMQKHSHWELSGANGNYDSEIQNSFFGDLWKHHHDLIVTNFPPLDHRLQSFLVYQSWHFLLAKACSKSRP